MIRYTVTIFLSAFLLFLVQPMIARFILPWFGGTSAVWTTCMMFFQIVLLLGYLYSHLVRRMFSPRVVCLIHVGLLVIAGLMLRTEPPGWLKPDGGENLTLAIIRLLAMTVGLPFFALATTGPLIQAWHSLSHGGRTYRLYAVSNLGSILALLSYPFLVEPSVALREQSYGWTVGFVVFAVLCVWSGQQTFGKTDWVNPEKDQTSGNAKRAHVSAVRIVLWVVLSMAPSIVLLATTNLMCQEVASIPFLWILPLSLYLLTLIICFDRPGLYRRAYFLPLAVVSVVAATIVMLMGAQLTLLVQVIALAVTIFACGMICHGELERLKPEPGHLTLFFLMVSVGGALGGIFVVVIAPQIFNDYFEFHIGLIISLIVPTALIAIEEYRREQPRAVRTWLGVFAALAAVTCVLCSVIHLAFTGLRDNVIARVRNEYGLVLVIDDVDRVGGAYRVMVNGRTEHGGQYLDPDRGLEPSGYYVEGCGAQLALTAIRESRVGHSSLNHDAVEQNAIEQNFLSARNQSSLSDPLRVGVIGLGTGSLVSWMEPADEVWFYEINPVVEVLAREHFSYLDQRDPATTTVITGDGRVQLERQLASNGSQQFDVLMMDAFTSDSIPAHLLTEECFELYLTHLKPSGVIVAHITNKFVDLRPVLFQHAEKFGLTAILIDHEKITSHMTRWVLLTRNPDIFNNAAIQAASTQWPDQMKSVTWTDDFSSLAPLVDWSFGVELDLPNEQVEIPGAAADDL